MQVLIPCCFSLKQTSAFKSAYPKNKKIHSKETFYFSAAHPRVSIHESVVRVWLLVVLPVFIRMLNWCRLQSCRVTFKVCIMWHLLPLFKLWLFRAGSLPESELQIFFFYRRSSKLLHYSSSLSPLFAASSRDRFGKVGIDEV